MEPKVPDNTSKIPDNIRQSYAFDKWFAVGPTEPNEGYRLELVGTPKAQKRQAMTLRQAIYRSARRFNAQCGRRDTQLVARTQALEGALYVTVEKKYTQ
jgi:hypothetical protein